MNTIESLLEMSLDKLIAMSDTEIDAYLAEALKVCPPTKIAASRSVSKNTLQLGGGKMAPRSALAQQLADMSPQKRQLMKMAQTLGIPLDEITGGKEIK